MLNVERLKEKNDSPEPLLWSMGQCAAALGVSLDHFRRRVRWCEGVPQPLPMPGQPRWSREEWQRWAREGGAG